MVQLNPILFEEVGLKPSNGMWVCCSDSEAFTLCDLSVTIVANYIGENEGGFPDYEWDITEISAAKPIPGYRFRAHYAQLTGAQYDDARAWLLSHEADRLATHVAHDYQIAESGYKADKEKEEAI